MKIRSNTGTNLGIIIVVFFIVFIHRTGFADIHGYQDQEGYWHFYPSKSNPTRPYEKLIKRAAKKFGIEPSMIKAIIRAESEFNHLAVSKKGARGLMQLMPPTAKQLNVKNPIDPAENIFGGTRYFKSLLFRFKNNTTLALAAYNAGPAKVETFQGVPPYRETQTFVQRVLRYYRYYQSIE